MEARAAWVVRRGARRAADVPRALLDSLEKGELSTVNHIEQMSINQARLWVEVFPELAAQASRFDGRPFIERLRTGGELLALKYERAAWRDSHPNEPDLVTAWRTFSVAYVPLTLGERLCEIRRFALHDHFAVREWAWLAARPHVSLALDDAVAALSAEIMCQPSRWRRFACEITRPRSVWAKHLPALKEEPWRAEPLLLPLLRDNDLYVLTSLTNWLNDVCSEQAEWVSSVIARYAASGVKHLAWFRRRATRRRLKKAHPQKSVEFYDDRRDRLHV
jgi:3-methyladenine DNA glycosylase AlkC